MDWDSYFARSFFWAQRRRCAPRLAPLPLPEDLPHWALSSGEIAWALPFCPTKETAIRWRPLQMLVEFWKSPFLPPCITIVTLLIGASGKVSTRARRRPLTESTRAAPSRAIGWLGGPCREATASGSLWTEERR